MKNTAFRITAAALLVFILLFNIGTVLRHKGMLSYHENRKLEPMPEASVSSFMDGSCSRQLGRYMTDHFACRSLWIAASADIQANLTESIVNGVYVSSKRLLNADFPETFPTDKAASSVNRFTSEHNGAVYFVAVPTSSGVYSDELPPYMTVNYEREQINAVYDSLDNRIRTVDACNILKMLNDHYIYYRNDSKWTSYGAYCVYRTVIQKLGFQPVTLDKYTINHISDDFYGNLYNRTRYTKAKADLIDIYEYPEGARVMNCTKTMSDGKVVQSGQYDIKKLNTGYKYDVYAGERAPVTNITTDVNNDKKLLVIGDSYVDCFIPFLVQHYTDITVVYPEELEKPVDEYIDTNDYEQTLFLFGIDSIGRENFFENINC